LDIATGYAETRERWKAENVDIYKTMKYNTLSMFAEREDTGLCLRCECEIAQLPALSVKGESLDLTVAVGEKQPNLAGRRRSA
jgi:hypothetical protein